MQQQQQHTHKNDVHRLHKYKLPPPYFSGDYSNYDEWRFKLQADLGLIDNEFGQILRAADVATNTVVDQHLINEVLPHTARGNKLVNLARNLHHILISICQGPASTVVRQNRYTANGCETLLNNRSAVACALQGLATCVENAQACCHAAAKQRKSGATPCAKPRSGETRPQATLQPRQVSATSQKIESTAHTRALSQARDRR